MHTKPMEEKGKETKGERKRRMVIEKVERGERKREKGIIGTGKGERAISGIHKKNVESEG